MLEEEPTLGPYLFAGLLSLVSLGSLLLIFLDYHKRSKIQKALLFIAAIVSTGWLFMRLPHWWKMAVVLISPLLVFTYVLVARMWRKA